MIICCGEALIDMIPTINGNGETALLPRPGGAVFNTAIACGRLGANTGFISGVSTDLFGMQLRQTLAQSNVNTEFLVTSERPTTLAFVSIKNNQASYTFYDENTAGRMLELQQMPTIPTATLALFFGGISLINPPCATFFQHIAKQEQKNRLIMLDPNIRPAFIQDDDSYRRRLDDFMSYCDILKLSDEDLNWLIPGDDSLAHKIETLFVDRQFLLILTRGEKGSAAYIHGKKIAEAQAIPTQISDTVGAGDTFNAGFLVNLDRHGLLSKKAVNNLSPEQISAALHDAARVSSITVSRVGANPPWQHELD